MMVKRWYRSRRNQLVILFIIVLCIAYYFCLHDGLEREPDLDLTRSPARSVSVSAKTTPAPVKSYDVKKRPSVLEYIESRLQEALKEDKGSGCEIPHLDPFSKEVTQFDKEYPKVVCSGEDWVKCYHSTCKVVPSMQSMKDISCTYNDIIYDSDQKHHLGPNTVVLGDRPYILTASDHVKIMCTGGGKKWLGYATGFRTTVERIPPPPGREDTLNVLIFGFDSTAKNGFIRRMPKSYKYITQVMKATVLNGYNIVGDGTPASLFPILTGKTELELPDVRKSMKNNGSMDSMPFIFYKMKADGYRTAYFEDMPWIGTFQYRFNGFRHQPADHYLRHFYLEESTRAKWWKRSTKYCIGDVPQYKLMMNITDQFLQLDGKKYIFTFIADITHDDFNMISTADDDMVQLLETFVKRNVMEDTLIMIMGDHGPREYVMKKLTISLLLSRSRPYRGWVTIKHNGMDMVQLLETFVKRNVLENTVLMIMGDHGPRYANVRDTFQGKLEERLPLMAVLLPEKLKRQRPEVQSALEANVNALTTPHDIYATVLDVLDMKQHWNPYKVAGADLPRGMTLLEPIPRNRSCSEAGIEPHWCACLAWKNVSSDDDIYYKAANAFVDYINSLTQSVRSECVPRTLSEIKWVMRQRANKRMLQFAGAKDADGYVGNFNAHVKVYSEHVQIKVVVGPGRGIYEASMKYLVQDDKFQIDWRDISRTNAYGEEPSCMSARLPHLNPFCYCKSYLSQRG